MLHKNPSLFQDPKIEYPIHDLNLNFDDYIKQSRTIIANNRQDIDNYAKIVIDANTPFEFKPPNKAKQGVLLIHGLLDSPFIMREIGERLCTKGFLARAIMLPGHATVPGALLNTDYTEWVQAVSYGIATLKNLVEKIFIVGFSTGATLALHHALENDGISGVIMIAPAIRINSPFTFTANLPKKICPTWQRAQWLHISEEDDYVKYRSLPFNAIDQVYRLATEIKKMSPEKLAHCPLFLGLSEEDKIVSSAASIDYFKKSKNPLNQMLLYSSKPVQFNDPRIHVKNSTYPDMNILHFCHITLPVSPNNFHYGPKGDYPSASRLEENIKYGAFDKIDIAYHDLLYRLNLSKFQYERLTFNPDFNFLMSNMEEFISKI